MALEDIQRSRLEKRQRYEARGFESYPATVKRTFLIGELRRRAGSRGGRRTPVTIVGRLRAWREHGSATFGDLEDGSGRVQLYFSRHALRDGYDFVLETIDIGDFLEVHGAPFTTKGGELTIRVASWRIIAKSLRPLPEKWHGLKDVEERFRRRYLDLLMNAEVRRRFLLRSALIRAIRDVFYTEGFLEVETPMLQHVAGGALARPFKTHHNALGMDLYLRIAPELPLKELLVGGFEKVFELGKSFRNEGIDVSHNPEFTTIEWYAAYWDEEVMMAFVERCFAAILKKIGVKKIIFGGKPVSFGKTFARLSFTDALQRHALIVDYNRETRDSLATRAKQFGVAVGPHEPKGKIADEIFKKVCRPKLVNPTFLIHHPIEISPLAKRTRENAATVRRLQLIAGGLELVNAYAELNDPREQSSRFEEQAKARAGGEEEAHPMDEEFVEALEYGMPPATGAAIGIDRLVMLLTDTANIREVVLFPTLRPR